MVLREFVRTISSISNNFEKHRSANNEFAQNVSRHEQASFSSVEKRVLTDLNNLESKASSLNENLSESALDSYAISSLRVTGVPTNFESILMSISEVVHNLEVNFDEYYDLAFKILLITSNQRLLLDIIREGISNIVREFNIIRLQTLPVLEKKLPDDLSSIEDKLVKSCLKMIVKELDSKYSEHKSATKQMFNEFENYMSKTRVAAESDFKELDNKLNEIIEAYDATKIELKEKSDQMDEVLGHTANRVMANDYDTSAVSEKKSADWLRYGSLGCMAIIVLIVCSSFYDSTHSGFDWENSIFRTVLVFILSIPAAYLSRESTKHREQQYNYHHTALDLKAITPYIASLPEADQNRIKISIAERIFASRQTNLNPQDSFPLNTQELMMELIKKVDLSRKSEQQDKAEKGS
ncbi:MULTISPECIES: hypothetical protein [Pseudoalteromonas]|uniref:hypothetical protein n=1 Tax=Pseudoalteromonas TaxID=53246 RepID=UPI0002E68BDC|nr:MULTISPECIES: hypothetical protein [Pseudoalteromonas]MCF6145247.1 hypothetical protein [Pseudoalteromonas mariniglutinosa NCIMB 1770]